MAEISSDCYKILVRREGQLQGLAANALPERYVVKYSGTEPVFPTAEGSLLFAFDSLANAAAMRERLLNRSELEIWRCEVLGDVYRSLGCRRISNFQTMDEYWSRSKNGTEDVSWDQSGYYLTPRGTILVAGIKLVERCLT